MTSFTEIKSISQLHQLLGYDKPKHPLISIIDFSKIRLDKDFIQTSFVLNLYMISLKITGPQQLQYGRNNYDFEEGTMMFMSPRQAFALKDFGSQTDFEGWGLFFHPDMIIKYPLGNKIKSYGFFSYDVSEALHLSEDEKTTVSTLAESIKKEYSNNLDNHSQDVIITAIEQLLNYSQRFYGRQFITRNNINGDIVAKFEQLITEFFSTDQILNRGLPGVDYFSSKLNLSTGYLADLLKKETGKTTKEHIQIHLVEKAKYRLLNSSETVSEIAYSLGFEYPQYFNRLFKSKTGMTPLEYRELN